MKRTTIILIATIFLTFSGCIGTKIYLGGDKREITDDTPIDRAIDPTSIPAGGTWGSVRTILNTNLSNINGTLDSVEVTLAEYGDSITNYSADIQLRLLKSDTASMLENYTRNGELNSALAAKVNVSDTAAMLNPYAKLTDLSEGGIGIGAVQEVIADSLNVLRAAVTVGNGTKAPYFDGSQDGGQILYFYGDNGFYTALQGGAPTANRSYRLPIAALPSAGHKAYLNIDQYGNMGFIDTTLVGGADSSIYATRYFTGQTYALASALSTLSTRTDSIVDVLADTANLETVLQIDLDTDTLADLSEVRLRLAIADTSVMLTPYITRGDTASMLANYALLSEISEVSIDSLNLNGGSLTLTGDDKLTFETNGDASYSLPAGGGNLTIMSQVQGWINDSLDVFRPLYVEVADTATMLANYALLSEISEVSIDSLNLNGGSLTLTGDDKLTFETNGDASYSLPAGGGNLTIMSQVQGWINDSLDVFRPLYVEVADTASMLSNYLLDSETAASASTVTGFTPAGGSLTLSGADALTFTTTAETNVTLPTTGTLVTTTQLIDTVLRRIEPIFVFGGGGGNAGDTTSFTTSTIYGAFFNEGKDTLAVTSLRVIMLGDATDTLSVDILWDVNLNDSTPTELNSDPFPVNSLTTGDEDTSFAAYKIPPDNWVWCETPGVVSGRKPTYFIAQINGYRIKAY